jgi:ADP-ribose pyrophosphatase YjhB (NUDIX family)
MTTNNLKMALSLARARMDFIKARWPAGTPASKGGQFAPKQGGGSGVGGKLIAPQYGAGDKNYAPLFGNWGNNPPSPPPIPKGAKPHAQMDDMGKPVMIHYPTRASEPATWTNKDAVATFTPNGKAPEKLNGVSLKPWDAPKTKEDWAKVGGTNPALEDIPFETHPTKKTGAGVLIVEPDGRVWLTRPTNSFGGYVHTFPKGTAEDGLSLQQNAIKEAFEETGLRVKITGLLGDFERDTSKARYYVAQRVGGTPSKMGWESQAIRLAPMSKAVELLNKNHDKDILDGLSDAISMVRKQHDLLLRIVKQESGKGAWSRQPRWPAGAPVGGQWKEFDGDGFPLPPKVGEAAGDPYWKKGAAIYTLAKQNDIAGLQGVVSFGSSLESWTMMKASGIQPSEPLKAAAGNDYYAMHCIGVLNGMIKADAAAYKVAGPSKISNMAHVGSKPGGSNPGGMYEDTTGTKWLVKGSNAGPATEQSKNEVLASKLLGALGVGSPDMKLVDMEGKYGGGIGVASKWVDGLKKFDKSNPAHLAAVQSDFAIHAWLGNYDVIGMGYDNVMINAAGKAVNIDPGGALLYRAQGKLKDPAFGQTVGGGSKVPMEFASMRQIVTGVPTNDSAHAIFGSMTASQLIDSSLRLQSIDNDTITKLVMAFGPGSEAARENLAATLIERRHALIVQAKQMQQSAPPPKAPTATTTTTAATSATQAPAGTVPLQEIKTASLTPTLHSFAFKGANAVFFTQYSPQQGYAEGTITAFGKPPSEAAAAFAAQMKAAQDAGYTAQYFKVSSLQQAYVWIKDGNVLTKAGAAALVAAGVAPAAPASAGIPAVAAGGGVLISTFAQQKAAGYLKQAGALDLMSTKDREQAQTILSKSGNGPLSRDEAKTLTGLLGIAANTAKDDGFKVYVDGVNAVIKDIEDSIKASAATGAGQPTAPAAPAATTGGSEKFGIDPKNKSNLLYLVDGASKAGLISAKEDSVATDIAYKLAYGTATAMEVQQFKDILAPAAAIDNSIKQFINATLPQTGTQAPGAPVSPAAPTAPTAPASSNKYGLAAGIHVPSFVESTGKAVPFYENMIKNANEYHANGNLSMLEYMKEKVKQNSYNGKEMNKVLDGMIASLKTGQQSAAAATLTTTVTPPPATKANPNAPAMPDPAAYSYSADKLGTGATAANNASHNAKISAIYTAGQAGNIGAILSMGFAKNAYGVKAAKFANNVLAALGSDQKVDAGQKKGTHKTVIAANGGEIVIPPPTAPAAPTPTQSKPIYRIPEPPNFANWNGPGSGLSSKPALNAQNDAVAAKIYELAKANKIAELKALTFDQINADGTSTGTSKLVSEHPSKNIVAYWKDALAGATTPYVPPPVITAGEFRKAVEKFAAIANAFATPKSLPEASAKMGRYAVLGKVTGDVLAGWNVKEVSQQSGGVSVKSLYKQSKDGYDALTATERAAIKDYTGGSYSAMNAALSGLGTHSKVDYAINGIKKAAVALPEGTVLSRKFDFSATFGDTKKAMQALLASEGNVIQDFGMISTATTAGTWSGGIHLRITTAPGAKGLYVGSNPSGGGAAISNHPSENEVILPYKSKFYVKKIHKEGHKFSDEHGSWGQSAKMVVELVLLPD